tara:strand:+ start:302 stop:625 length:324 start_codon:yes stop_codon:yes gene_type:complete
MGGDRVNSVLLNMHSNYRNHCLMKNHTKVYHEAFCIEPGEWIGCEVCDRTAVDIHHIHARGMGGNKEADTPENLQALCRECHIYFGDKKQFKRMLITMHHERLQNIY